MSGSITGWIKESRAKQKEGKLADEDFAQLEALLNQTKLKVLYLYSKSTNILSPVMSWALYDPRDTDEPKLPSQNAPFQRVIDAMADGWRIVQFPIPQMHRFSEIDNDYLGFEFILEKEI